MRSSHRFLTLAWSLPWALSGLTGCSGPSDAPIPYDRDSDGYVDLAAGGDDCDDTDAFVHPGATEYCDGRDDDCDGTVDGPDPLGQRDWYRDGDGDGYGVPGDESRFGCDPGPGWAETDNDCDDADLRVHPRRDDPCDGVDNDCDGETDEDPTERWYVDADGDGHGDPERTRRSCEGTVALGDDCDDTRPEVHPGAPEYCDGLDNDCDQRPDAFEDVLDPPVWYADLDRDGFGVAEITLEQCVPPNDAWALVAGDCDDLDADSHPGAIQRCVPRDTDCDGQPGDDGGWFAPDFPVRVPLLVAGTGADQGQPVTLVLDYRAALDAAGIAAPFDPGAVVVAVQDCAASGASLPAAAVDGLGDVLGPGDPTDPVGDERGLLAFVLDRPLAVDETLPLAVYLGGPPQPGAGGLSTTAAAISAPSWSASFDPDRGGIIDVFTAGGVRALSQADAREGNGIRTDGRWTQLSPAPLTVRANAPAFGALSADAIHSGPDGDLRLAVWWFAFDGLPALYGRLTVEAITDLSWDDPLDARLAVRPFEFVPLDLQDPLSADGPDHAAITDGATGVALAWAQPPSDVASLACDAYGCAVAASEGQGTLGGALAGERLIDDRILAVVPFDGTAIEAGTLDAARVLPSVAAGAPELRAP